MASEISVRTSSRQCRVVAAEFGEGLGAGVVDVGHGGGVDDQDLHRGVGGGQFRADALAEEGFGLEEQGCAEPVDEHVVVLIGGRELDPGLQAGDHVSVGEQDGVVGVVLAAQPVDQRQDDRQEDALLHPHEGHHQEGDHGHEELGAAGAAHGAQGAHLDELDADGEHDGVEDPRGDVFEQPGQEQQHEGDRDGHGDVDHLAFTAGGVPGGGAWRGAVDCEPGGERAGEVRCRQSDQVALDAVGVAVLLGEARRPRPRSGPGSRPRSRRRWRPGWRTPRSGTPGR